MKKILLGTILAATVIAVPFTASARGKIYVDGAFGESSYSIDDAGMNKTSTDEAGAEKRISGGYMFTENVGVEGGVADHGKAANVYNFGTETSPLLVTVSGKSRSTYVAAVVRSSDAPDQFALLAKLGVSRNHGSITGSSGAVGTFASGNKTGVLLGVGVAYNFGDMVSTSIEYTHYGKVADDVKVDAATVGIRFKF